MVDLYWLAYFLSYPWRSNISCTWPLMSDHLHFINCAPSFIHRFGLFTVLGWYVYNTKCRSFIHWLGLLKIRVDILMIFLRDCCVQVVLGCLVIIFMKDHNRHNIKRPTLIHWLGLLTVLGCLLIIFMRDCNVHDTKHLSSALQEGRHSKTDFSLCVAALNTIYTLELVNTINTDVVKDRGFALAFLLSPYFPYWPPPHPISYTHSIGISFTL